MRRTASAIALALVAAAAGLWVRGFGESAAAAAGAPSLPAGFEIVDYPTGQSDYNLTNFAWLSDGGLLTSGKDGTVTYVPPGGVPRLIGQVPNVRAIGDHGMLGFALAPDYATSGNVYITFDRGDVPGVGTGTGFGMVEEWQAAPANSPQTFTRVRTLIDGSTMSPAFTQETTNHGLDSVVVAPDGTLFVSVGDDSRNNGGPNTLRAQDVGLPYGKILHLTADGDGVPDNPFYSAAAPHSWRSMVYAYGMRNPFRFDIDSRNGILQLGDVGWNTWEEVDSVTKGMNGGWPCYEANVKTTLSVQTVCQQLYAAGTATFPIVSYPHAGSGASVTGGMHYTGTAYPDAYQGSWFYADYVRGILWTLTTDSSGGLVRAPETNGFASSVGGPVAFHPGPNGDVTFADITTSSVRRLVYTSANRDPTAQIDTQVDPDTKTVTFSGARSTDPDGDNLTYQWDFGDSTSSTDPAPVHAYADDTARTVTLTVKDPQGATSTASVVVHPGNHSPVLTLTTPPPGTTFAVGEPVQVSATATDVEDGDLVVHWISAIKHCPFVNSCHLHPEGPQTGSTFSEGFEDHTFDSTLLVTAQVTDSAGATATATYEAQPRLHSITVTSPFPVAINGVLTGNAQAVENSEVELAAPTSSTYHVFKSWSDGGAASHSFTMPATSLSLTAVYQTAIDARYAAMGGAGSLLGKPTKAEYSTSGGGRARDYVGGRMYWGPSSGTYYLTGAILTTYLAKGGPAKLGLPTKDNTPVSGGDYSLMTGNHSVFHQAGKSAFVVQGAILTHYRSLGYQASCLGFPVGAQATISTGLRQSFVHGTITYTSATKKTTHHCA